MADIPVIQQGGKNFSLSELINKQIVAFQNTTIYRLPTYQKTIYFLPEGFVAKGKYIYSAVSDLPLLENGTGKLIKSLKQGDYIGIYMYIQNGKVYVSIGGKAFYFLQGDIMLPNEKFYFDAKEYTNAFDNVVAQVKKGDSLGKLDTWVKGSKQNYDSKLKAYQWEKTSQVWLSFRMVQNNAPKSFYVPLEDKTIDVAVVTDQGAQTVEQQQQEQAESEKSWFQKMAEGLEEKVGKTVKTVLIGGAVVFVVVKLGQSFISAKVNKQPPPQKN